MPLTPTDEQQVATAIFRRREHMSIRALAGTGKTSTLVLLSKEARLRGLYLAFNKAIANEARTLFPAGTQCSTIHSLAFRSVCPKYSRVGDKLTKSLGPYQSADLLGISSPKNFRMGVLRPTDVGQLILATVLRFCWSDKFDFDAVRMPRLGRLAHLREPEFADLEAYVVKQAAMLWDRMADPSSEVLLGHDGYLKVWALGHPRFDYDYVLVDEAQDLNPAMISALRNNESCQRVLVGDSFQQLYEWRGAVDAMEHFHHTECALTRSFRFGINIAAVANRVLAELESPLAVTGLRSGNDLVRVYQTNSQPPDSTTILCRTNTNVVSTVIDAFGESKSVCVVGGPSELLHLLKDAEQLISGIPASTPALFGLRDWKELQEFSRDFAGSEWKTFVDVVDRFGVDAIRRAVEKTTEDESRASIVVSTVHKAKGRQWRRVRLHDDILPATGKGIDQQLLRLIYVAVTRAMERLELPPNLWTRFAQGLAQNRVDSEVPKSCDDSHGVRVNCAVWHDLKDSPRRKGEPWREPEDERLRIAYQAGAGIADISKAHRRSEGAIRARLTKLGLLIEEGKPRSKPASTPDTDVHVSFVVSEALYRVIQVRTTTAGTALRLLWQYALLNGLLDTSMGRIFADDNLLPILRSPTVLFSEVPSIVREHLRLPD